MSQMGHVYVHFRISKSFFRLDMGPAQSGMGPLGLTWTLLGIVNVLMTGLSLLRPCNCPHDGWPGTSQAYVSISRPGMYFIPCMSLDHFSDVSGMTQTAVIPPSPFMCPFIGISFRKWTPQI